MTICHILGYPRIGPERELKFALEAYWRGDAGENALLATGARVRAQTRARQIGLGLLTAGDFSLYDHVLDHAVLLGCLPERFGLAARAPGLAGYFAAARGSAGERALEMTKWFDTNYHYLVPELSARTRFEGGPDWYFEGLGEALGSGAPVKAVLIGPLTFLRLGKAAPGFDRLRLVEPIAGAYRRILDRLASLGIEWVQLDEPALCLDLEPAWLDACERAYAALGDAGPRRLLATYFGGVGAHAHRIVRLPVHGVHIDLVRAPEEKDAWLTRLPREWVLSAGILDGRNVWRADLRGALATLRPLHEALGERLWLAPSCSLLHVPVSAAGEDKLDPEVRPWLAFADEKIEELAALAEALDHGEAAARGAIGAADAALAARRASRRVRLASVRQRADGADPEKARRRSPYAERAPRQRERLRLPALPTTTIGSFPQTSAVRATRAAFRRGDIGHLAYLEAMRGEIRRAIAAQEAAGLDVLVHGEAERNDMVEYFAEQLWGYCITQRGWVQSYGSRCVKPPLLYGDVMRPEPMTLDPVRYAQSLTARPVKGMLTGPVTLLQWSFVRDDEPRETVALQLALAVREEVEALQQAGIRVIQIDEPALREGLPLRQRDRARYLDWAARAFRIAASAADDDTQIHTHMCYAEFEDILPAIAALDADVITLEASRSNAALLDEPAALAALNQVGPGVYDVHSPAVPSVEVMAALIERAARVIGPQRLWVNPDCGLKTRDWPETEAALRNMVDAARRVRERIGFERAREHAADVARLRLR